MKRAELEKELEKCREKVRDLAVKYSDIWPADCETDSQRGANWCRFEGTLVCWLCQLADMRLKIQKLEAENNVLRIASLGILKLVHYLLAKNDH